MDGNLPAPLLDVSDLPGGQPAVYGWPYFTPLPLAHVLAPTIDSYLDQQLPIILPPYIDPAAQAAVAATALLRAGDTATGPIYTTVLLPTSDSEFATKVYVDTQVASIPAFPEAPVGPSVFGRNSTSGWLQVLPLTGGTLTGALTLAADPGAALQPVTLQYYNAHLPTVPAASSTPPIMDSTAAVGTGTTWARADHVHPTDTSRFAASGGTLSGSLTATGGIIGTAIGATTPAAGSFTTLGASGVAALTGGLNFGSQLAASVTDLSKHLALYVSGFGLNVTSGTINYVVPANQSHSFNIGGTAVVAISNTGINNAAIGATTPAAGTFTSVKTGSTAGPTWTTGTAAPASTQPVGSIYSNTSGTAGARLYVSAGGGTWNAVAGV